MTIKCTGTLTTEDISLKGIKANSVIELLSGTYNIDTMDDCIHSNDTIVVKDGIYTLKSSDDAVHADSFLNITGGTIQITGCYEGLESGDITIAGGNIDITSSDDGINGAGGQDGNANNGFGNDIFQPGRPGGGQPGGTANSIYKLLISGGDINVNSAADGVDVNGDIYMTGGKLIIYGPTDNANASLDYDKTFVINGGILMALGSTGMAQAPSETSSQPFVQMSLSARQLANTAIRISEGSTELITVNAKKAFQSVIFSLPAMKIGNSYVCTIGSQNYELMLQSIKTTYGNANQNPWG
jgi:hypothetical protein